VRDLIIGAHCPCELAGLIGMLMQRGSHPAAGHVLQRINRALVPKGAGAPHPRSMRVVTMHVNMHVARRHDPSTLRPPTAIIGLIQGHPC
jgi:hypothetical protein